jgi:hypothetical protein
MPFQEGLGLDDDQSFRPIEEPGEQDHNGARGNGRASRLHITFLKQSELLAKEQVLGDERKNAPRYVMTVITAGSMISS